MDNTKRIIEMYKSLEDYNDSIARMKDCAKREELKRGMFDVRKEILKLEEE